MDAERADDPGVEVSAARTSRRRLATRARLVEAAERLFRERGTLNLSVEALCEQAGFTRGAFYSNFSSVDDVFLSGFVERSRALEIRLASSIEDAADRFTDPMVIQDVVDVVLRAFPVDTSWNAIRAGLLSRTPQDERITSALHEQAEHFCAQLERLLTAAMPHLHRTPVTDPATLARAVMAVDAGTQLQVALYRDPAAIRSAAITGVLLGLTRASSGVEAPSDAHGDRALR